MRGRKPLSVLRPMFPERQGTIRPLPPAAGAPQVLPYFLAGHIVRCGEMTLATSEPDGARG